MKWIIGVLFIVLLAPVAGHAEDPILTSKFEAAWFKAEPEYGPSLSQLTLKASEAIDHLRVSIFFNKKRQHPDAGAGQKGRCVMVLNQQAVPDMEKYLYHSDEGPEIWLPHLEPNEEVVIGIVWKKEKKKIGTFKINVATADESYYRAWTINSSTLWFSKDWAHWARNSAEFSLDDVCESYTLSAARHLFAEQEK